MDEVQGDMRIIAERIPWVVLVALTGLGCWLRLRIVEPACLTQDGLHPTLRAISILRLEHLPLRGEAVGFHFGMLQPWIMVPLVAMAGSLRQVWLLNALIHGLGAVPLGLAGRRLHSWPVGLIAAFLYSTWPILVYHPQSGAWTYQAPVLVACAVWMATIALSRPSRAALFGLAAALAVAVHWHPFALAAALPAAVLLPRLVQVQGWRRVAESATLGVLILTPMVIDNLHNLIVSAPGQITADLIARNEDRLWLMTGVINGLATGWPENARFLLWAGPAGGVVATALRWFTARRLDRGGLLVCWLLAGYGVLLSLGWGLGHIRCTHAGPMLPLHALILGWVAVVSLEAVLGRLRRVARVIVLGVAAVAVVPVAAVLWVSVAATTVPTNSGMDQPPLERGPAHLSVIDTIGRGIHEEASGGPFVLYALIDLDIFTDAPMTAYHGDLYMRGAEVVHGAEALDLDDADPTAFVATALDARMQDAWGGDATPFFTHRSYPSRSLSVYRFDHLSEAHAWLDLGCEQLHAYPRGTSSSCPRGT